MAQQNGTASTSGASLGMIESAMLDKLREHPATFEELLALAKKLSLADLTTELQHRYPAQASLITPERVERVMGVLLPGHIPGTPSQTSNLDQGKAQQEHDISSHLGGFKERFSSFFGFGSGKKKKTQQQESQTQAQKEKSAIEQMRDKLVEFDEDYKDLGERLLGFFCQLVGYVGPFALMLWIGADLGKYYAPVMDAVPAYGLAFTIEAIIAACTVAMGRAFAEVANGKPNYGKTIMVVLIWLVLNASSAFGLYLVMTVGQELAPFEQFSMGIRVGAIALGDLGCSAVLMFKGRSIQKHIESIRKRATAIGELADAQRSINEADKNAELREQMMKATLQIQEDLSKKIGEAVSMVMESILEKMEKALKEEPKGRNEGRYGTR